MADPQARSFEEKLELVLKWSDWFYEHTETFRGSLGTQLAYLWPAILKDRQIEVSSRSTIVQILKQNEVPDTDNIWDYIDVVG